MKAGTRNKRAEHQTVGDPKTTLFERFAKTSVRLTGHPLALGLAAGTIVIWAVTGPFFHFSDTWQLVINTGTTIVTFLMVFLIQNAQNRDNQAIQLKLDELIRSSAGAHNAFLDVEEISEPELDKIKGNFGRLARQARDDVRSGRSDLGCPEVKKSRNGASTRHHPSYKHAPASAGTKQKEKEQAC